MEPYRPPVGDTGLRIAGITYSDEFYQPIWQMYFSGWLVRFMLARNGLKQQVHKLSIEINHIKRKEEVDKIV